MVNWSFVRFIDGKMVHAPIGNFLRSTWNFSPDYSAKKTRQVIKKVARTTPETGLNYSEKFNSLIISVTWYRFETFHPPSIITTNFASLTIVPSLFRERSAISSPFHFSLSSLFHRPIEKIKEWMHRMR